MQASNPRDDRGLLLSVGQVFPAGEEPDLRVTEFGSPNAVNSFCQVEIFLG